MRIEDLPKVELHLHLDCSLSYRVACRLDPQLTADDYRENFIAPPKCLDLADFLQRAPQGIRLMQNKRALELVVDDLFEQLQADRVIYAEIRFGPLLHTDGELTPHEVVETIDRAVEKAMAATGIEARLILATLRSYSEEQSLTTVQLVEDFRGSRVVAFDIAGNEAGFPVDAHVAAFRYAREHGIPCTAHAGEACGPASVWETLQHFQPLRLGHGVRSIEDPGLVKELIRRKVHLEICPTCNIQTDVFPTYAEHPIQRLYTAGVSLGINTDTRTITNITLNEEYQKLAETFGWTERQFIHCNRNAIDAGFISEDLKTRLRQQLPELNSPGSPA